MQAFHTFTLNVSQWGLMTFVLAMTFFSGVLGGYLYGLTHTVRHADTGHGSKSIWSLEDEE